MIIYYIFLPRLSPATSHLVLLCQALNPDTRFFGFIFSVAQGRVVNLQKKGLFLTCPLERSQWVVYDTNL